MDKLLYRARLAISSGYQLDLLCYHVSYTESVFLRCLSKDSFQRYLSASGVQWFVLILYGLSAVCIRNLMV